MMEQNLRVRTDWFPFQDQIGNDPNDGTGIREGWPARTVLVA